MLELLMIRFEWDDKKAEDNWRDHKIRFEKAVEVFKDPHYFSEPDDRFEYDEERWRTIGMAKDLLLLIVAHTFRDKDDTEVIRIISARRAEPHERKEYDYRKLLGK